MISLEFLTSRHRPSGAAIGAGGSGASRTWFLEAVENFRFYDLKVYAFSYPKEAAAEVKEEGRINMGRIYPQDYVLFLRTAVTIEPSEETKQIRPC